MSAVKDSQGPVFAGIDIGGTSIKWMIVDEAGSILTQGNEPTDREAVAAQVGRIGARLASDYPGLVGFGLICPGLVDEESGTVVYAANLELRGVQLARAVEEATGVPAALMHDGRAAGLAEGLLGAGRGAPSFLRRSAPERSGTPPSSRAVSPAAAVRAAAWRSTPRRRVLPDAMSRRPARISARRLSRLASAPIPWRPRYGTPLCAPSPSR